MRSLIEKILHSEGVVYIIVGCLTTAVNFVVFALTDFLLKDNVLPENLSYKVAYVLAFVIAVIFAYWTNKFWVFHNYVLSPAVIIREFIQFMAARIVSGIISFLLMILLVDIMRFSHNFAWFITSVFNMVFNYVASKWWIFKKDKVKV